MYQRTTDTAVKTQPSAIEKEQVRVWPDLVLRETIAALVAVILLMAISVFFDAPLGGIADPSFSMNPSKAPWYFLGLQELLVYFTPWVAGVAIPVLIIIGLAAIPYIDVGRQQTKGRVVFTFEKQIQRLFSTGLCLWIVLTVIGLYFRGPNWAWQWPGGTPIASGSSNINLNWLLPVVILLYFAFGALVKKFRHREDGIGKEGFIRHFFSHILSIVGLTVSVKIAVYNILDLILK